MLAKLVIAVPLIVHGIAHIGGFLGLWTSAEGGFAASPWFLPTKLGAKGVAGRVFGLLWLLVMAGFVAAGLGLIVGQAWWTTAAILTAVLSFLLIAGCWTTVPVGAKIGAAFDLLVLALLLLPTKQWILDFVS